MNIAKEPPEKLGQELHILEIELQHKIEMVDKDIDWIKCRIKKLETNSVTTEEFTPIKQLYQRVGIVLFLGLLAAFANEVLKHGV